MCRNPTRLLAKPARAWLKTLDGDSYVTTDTCSEAVVDRAIVSCIMLILTTILALGG